MLRVVVEARTSAGLTQRDLAGRLGKPPSYIGKIEAGERNLSLLEFVALAKAMRTDPSDLLSKVTLAIAQSERSANT